MSVDRELDRELVRIICPGPASRPCRRIAARVVRVGPFEFLDRSWQERLKGKVKRGSRIDVGIVDWSVQTICCPGCKAILGVDPKAIRRALNTARTQGRDGSFPAARQVVAFIRPSTPLLL